MQNWAVSFAPASKSPRGRTAANRTDVKVIFDCLPEPIDLELDLENRMLYWTDRGDPPRGNTVRSRADRRGGRRTFARQKSCSVISWKGSESRWMSRATGCS